MKFLVGAGFGAFITLASISDSSEKMGWFIFLTFLMVVFSLIIEFYEKNSN